jgi:hypothetical protein
MGTMYYSIIRISACKSDSNPYNDIKDRPSYKQGECIVTEFFGTTAAFYKHSGKAPILGLILIGIAGFIAVPILGLIYGVLTRIIPFIYLNILLVFGFVYAVSYVLSQVAKFGKVRNMILLGLSAFFFGILADYIGWVAWLAVAVGDPLFLFEFFFPADIFYIISLVAEEGAWTLSGTTPTGGFLYILWIIEACIVIFGIPYLTLDMLAKTPFCEESNAWADKKSQIGAFTPIADRTQFKQSVAQGNFSAFNQLKLSAENEMHYTSLEVYECEQCRNFHVLNVNDVNIKINNKGRAETKVKSVVSNLLLSPIQLAGLKKLALPELQTPGAT